MTDQTCCEIFGRKELLAEGVPCALTIGNFDGVHLGHKYLISKLKQEAAGLPTVVVTFHPHPLLFFVPQTTNRLLTTKQQKISLLLAAGADVVVVQHFTHAFASQKAQDFCLWLKESFCIHTLLVGHDFRYGRERQGDFAHLKRFALTTGWRVKQIEPLETEEGFSVSSSRIRQAIVQGDVETAEHLLGFPFSVCGIVVKGNQRGRVLGFPTANIVLDPSFVLPKQGVYCAFVELNENGEQLAAVVNCGTRPTVSQDNQIFLEAHIFQFSRTIYNEHARFYLKKFLRPEKKFASIEDLKSQISFDIETTKTFLKK